MADEQNTQDTRGLDSNQDDIETSLNQDDENNSSDDKNNEGINSTQVKDEDEDEEDNIEETDIKTNNEYYGAPENYDFTQLDLPEGFSIDKDLSDEFTPIGKELNLSQQAANKLANLLVSIQQKQVANAPEQLAEFRKQEIQKADLEYQKMLENDPELGGNDTDRYNQKLDIAIKGLNAFGSDGLKNLIKEKGLGHHPDLIKHFYRLGKLTGQDKIINATNPVSQSESPAQILYGKSMNKEN